MVNQHELVNWYTTVVFFISCDNALLYQ